MIGGIIPVEFIIAALIAIFGGGGLYLKGRRSGAVRAENKGLRDYRDTRKAIDDATDDIHGDDPAAARRFLSERGKRSGDL